VPRSLTASKSLAQRLPVPEWVRALPWAALLQAAFVIGRRWHALSAKDRSRLTSLVRRSRGRLGNLSEKERAELRTLTGRLDPRGMGSELVALARGGRRGRTGKRRRAR
jgi:hypothetical protein